LRVDERGSIQFDNERADHGSTGVVFGVEKLSKHQVDERTSHSRYSKFNIKISVIFAQDKSINLPPVGH
jgi:hypothetical protein